MAKPIVYVRERHLFIRDQIRYFPASFTRKYAVKPTPGGRWKVRKLIDGRYRAYSEGPSKSFSKALPSFAEAVNYAHAQATIAREYNSNRSVMIMRRRLLQRRVYRDKARVYNLAYILALITEEKDDYYQSAREH